MVDCVTYAPTGDERASRREVLVLSLVLFGIALAVRLVCYTGLIASDDMGYARYASRLADGSYRLEAHHYAIRYGVLLPVAALYRTFGVHEWTTTALPLVASSIAPVLAALLALRFSGMTGAWLVGLLMVTFPPDVRYGSVLVPEPLLQAVLLGGALLYLAADERRSVPLGIASGVALALGYLTKEPAAFVAIAFVAVALARRSWWLAAAVCTGCALVVGSELLWYAVQVGDPFFRLHALKRHDASPMAVAANVDLPYRLLKEYPRMMVVPSVDFGLHSTFALAAAAAAIVWWRRRWFVALLLAWAALPFLYLNFGTTSFTHYWALPVAPRYLSLIYPPLFVLGVLRLMAWARGAPARARLVKVAVAGVCVVGIACAARTKGTGYFVSDVHRLEQVAATARATHRFVCQRDETREKAWAEVMRIVAPDRMGCGRAGAIIVRIGPQGEFAAFE